jgi:hypothetical protein
MFYSRDCLRLVHAASHQTQRSLLFQMLSVATHVDSHGNSSFILHCIDISLWIRVWTHPHQLDYKTNWIDKVNLTTLCYWLMWTDLLDWNSVVYAGHEWSKAWTALARLDAGMVGSNPTRGMNVYVYVYFIFVLSCVGRGLAAMSWSLIQGVLPTVLDKETEAKRKVSWMPHAPVGTKNGGKVLYMDILLLQLGTSYICMMKSYKCNIFHC